MDFIQHDVDQLLRGVLVPEQLVLATHQEVVQHFVVGQQNVRRRFPQRRLVRNHIGRAHDFVLTRAANIHPGGDLAPQAVIRINRLRHTPRLVFRQRIHGVEEDGLYPRCIPNSLLDARAVIEDGIEKALGFPRACPRCHQCVLRLLLAAREAFKCLELVCKWRKRWLDIQNVVDRARCRALKWQTDMHKWPFEQPVFRVGQKALHGGGDGIVAKRKRRVQIVQQRLAQLFGDGERNHERSPNGSSFGAPLSSHACQRSIALRMSASRSLVVNGGT